MSPKKQDTMNETGFILAQNNVNVFNVAQNNNVVKKKKEKEDLVVIQEMSERYDDINDTTSFSDCNHTININVVRYDCEDELNNSINMSTGNITCNLMNKKEFENGKDNLNNKDKEKDKVKDKDKSENSIISKIGLKTNTSSNVINPNAHPHPDKITDHHVLQEKHPNHNTTSHSLNLNPNSLQTKDTLLHNNDSKD